MTIHPKTSGAAVGAALGLMVVSVLGSVHGIHLTDDANAAIPGFLATLGAWLVPGPDMPPAVEPPVAKVIPVTSVPPPSA